MNAAVGSTGLSKALLFNDLRAGRPHAAGGVAPTPLRWLGLIRSLLTRAAPDGARREGERLSSWEQATGRLLDGIGLRSIRSKIIVFALSATLIPSVTMGWLSYRNNRRAIDEKIVQELTSLTSHASRELELWLIERRYEMKVFSSSYEISENLEKLNRGETAEAERDAALRRLRGYLQSVGGKFVNYQELIVLDLAGNVVASSSRRAGATGPSRDWLERARSSEPALGIAYWDDVFGLGVIIDTAPIRSPSGAFVGAMVAKIRFNQVRAILTRYTPDPSHELYLMTYDGEILISSSGLDGRFMSSRIEPSAATRLFADPMTPHTFRSYRGTPVLGTLTTIPNLAWGIVAEKDRKNAYAAIVRMRNVTLALITAVLLGIGLTGYLLGLTIVGPLNRLTHGATKVAGGDMEVNLPIHGQSELSDLTQVFNQMMGHLRKFRDENIAMNQELRVRNAELQTLSVTDSLTGLHNRTQLADLLSRELARCKRHLHPFSILMIDIDHFKRFNDTNGHQAGDDILRQVAEIIRRHLRASDVAARYGGEEFLILLTETAPERALGVAEKLRAAVEETRGQRKKGVTVSIGVASFPDDGDDVDTIIREADVALYKCKRAGRNRVAMASAVRQRGRAASAR